MITRIQSAPFGREYRTNCYLLDSGDSTLVIDPGAEPDRILAWIGARNVAGIVITHCHSDHIGAVNEVAAATGAPVMCGRADAAAVGDPHLSGFDEVDSTYAVRRIDRELADGDTIAWGTHTLQVLETPGHTPGSICLVDDDILITGDTLFPYGLGRSDFIRGDASALQHSARALGALPDQLEILPGHGGRTFLGIEKTRNLPLVIAAENA
ncbi:MBL fold metallo-hydrolase (plasmid) [Curtobacterium sp. MCLR17_007]|uniref:MBL fold metallo-hydrolase n=1 Tax=Curtobacterium sp. MCLR17_007 TaxID=2175648 RepID=UPI000DAA96AD|nr:MBL fold metallo-hydrolase [Curtobacterium sp. MCLR17_007]WIB62091.1 MBL fold metallo-hydrolase [Curtobacterium sp. MCLR17_007]